MATAHAELLPTASQDHDHFGIHRGMAADYGNLQIADDAAELKTRMLALNEQFSAALKSAAASPFESAVAKARRIVG
jgi:hypothetical protein